MPYQPQDLKRIQKFYQDSLNEYGIDDARSVHWIDTQRQLIRFEILLHIATIDGKKILDVGCGLGDFYKFLIKKRITTQYTGIDIVPEFINAAQRKYPKKQYVEASFIKTDIDDITDTYDYVFASGAMSFKVENNNEFYFTMIKKMYDLAKKGVAFNMLNKSDHIDDATFAAYDPKEVADYCQTLASRVEIVTDYLPQDFTVFLYKN
jgi:ubiquinone/menaquinone biosynthesis C-methylase UbiE